MRNALAGLLALGVLVLAANPAAAHALGAECTLVGGKVEVTAFYDDDTPADKATVRVQDQEGKTVAEGKTDNHGRWSMPRPAAGKYQVIVEAGGGHRTEKTMVVPQGGTSAADHPLRVSEGPTREEFTAFPWLKLVVGLAAIGGLCVGLWMARRSRRSSAYSAPH